MSLTGRERVATRAELAANLERSGLSSGDLAERLGVSVVEIAEAFELDAHPATVWAVRDEMERAIREQGLDPIPYSKLSERMRAAAQGWFGVGNAPR